MINTTPLRKKLLDLAFSGKLVPKTGEWKMVKLEEVCASIADGDHQAPPKSPEGIPFLVISNVAHGSLSFENTRFVPVKYFDSLSSERTPSRGDVLVTVTGSYGIVVKVDTDRKFCFQRHIAVLKPKQVLADYLLYILQATEVQKYFDKVATGTAQKTVGLAHLRNTSIPLPPLAEQRAIVSRLEELLALEKSIAEDAAAIDDLIAAAKRKILDFAVAGKLVKKRGEWKMVKGREIFLDTETRLPKGDYFDYIDIDAIDNKRHRIVAPKHIAVKDAPSRASRGVRAGDTLFSIVRPYLENIAYVDEEFSDCIASTGFFVCRPISDCDGRYLYWMMVSPKIVGGLNRFMKGDNSPSIRKGDIMSFDFPLPPLEEQHAIVAKVEELFAALDAMKGL